VHIALAARDANVKRFVYASSSSVYGDHATLPKVESEIGKPLSPYAATKLVDEIYARTFQDAYGIECVGLRYFNVFGARQDPEGAYAAVIPRWIRALLLGEPVEINGDGETTRDFCYIANVVQANLRAALTEDPSALNRGYNIAVGQSTSLNELFYLLRKLLAERRSDLRGAQPMHGPFRDGDIRHSIADISRAQAGLGYAPTHTLESGLREALSWYIGKFEPQTTATG